MSKFLLLTRPDGGNVYIRRDAIDRVLSANGRTEVFVAGAAQTVRESADTIIRLINV